VSHFVKSFAELSLKVVAVRSADNSDFEFEFPASGPQTTPCALTIPLEPPGNVTALLLPRLMAGIMEE
jgi:hypothetical protein